jgi:hypothetical protein
MHQLPCPARPILSSQGCLQPWVNHIDIPLHPCSNTLSNNPAQVQPSNASPSSYLCTKSKHLTYTEPHIHIHIPAKH